MSREALEMKKIEYDVNFSTALAVANAPNATEKKGMALVSTAEIKRELVRLEMDYLKEESLLVIHLQPDKFSFNLGR